MVNINHHQAVAVLKDAGNIVNMVVTREVLLPANDKSVSALTSKMHACYMLKISSGFMPDLVEWSYNHQSSPLVGSTWQALKFPAICVCGLSR